MLSMPTSMSQYSMPNDSKQNLPPPTSVYPVAADISQHGVHSSYNNILYSNPAYQIPQQVPTYQMQQMGLYQDNKQ